MKRKILSIFLILILTLGVSLVTVVPVAAATTWTVDDSGGADFTTIQAAIDAASPGDTINVAAGTYNENLVITKSLNLIGAGADVTFVSAAAATYTLKIKGNASPAIAGDVLVEGFTFEDTGHLNWAIIETDHIPIGRTLTFQNNNVTNGDGYGWWDYHSHGNLQLTGCVFNNVWNGIQLEGWDTGDVTIDNNEFVGFHYYTEAGVVYSDYPPGGINPFCYTTLGGAGGDCTNPYRITNNHIHDFVDPGYGIPINGGYPEENAAQYTDIQITGNIIENVGIAAIRLKNYAPAGQEADGGIINGLISHNEITGCDTGILVVGLNPGTEVHENNISGNTLGLDNQSDTLIDATYNWWGHASGPGGPDGRVNPAGKVVGKGDGISGPAEWDPYLPQSVGHTKFDPVPPGLQH